MDILKKHNVDVKEIQTIPSMIKYAGSEVRLDPTSQVEDFIDNIAKDVIKGLKGVENVYTQHVPRIATVVEDLIKGKLKDQQFPFYESGSKDKYLFLTGLKILFYS